RLARCAVPGCFLAELSSPSCHYARNFKKCKAQLTASLYKFYNETIFKNKLPNNMELLWNNKMRKTAGYCVMGKGPGPACQPYARIELSVKVCDNPERLRDTLVHEMCHAATWLINGQRDGHGRLWQLYARTATLVHPELPTVSRCHTYNITFKYRYECTRCKNSIGRHSKSLDTERFVCALCQGRFVLLPPEGRDGTPVTSRALTPFTRFVKEQYGTTRSARPDSSHADIMRILGEQFSKTRLQ
uniref:SprT-like domain-containing protein n=1 Tax=Petromyzon marinus TaxID=7757 RepID=S4RD99_PETMA